MVIKDDIYFMKEAIKEAQKSYQLQEVPVGCVIVIDKKIISRGHNLREKETNPLSHAELNAIRKASKKLKRWILDDATIYITLEPCMMCCGAILQARFKRVVYGASQLKFGCCGSVVNLLEDNNFNHTIEVTRGVFEDQISQMMKEFFKTIRKNQ